jgi:hypothetical protein
MDEQEQRGSGLIDRVAKVKSEAAKRVPGSGGSAPVVSATRERAQAAGRAAVSQLPATREDVQKLQASLDRIEAELVHLAAKVDALKPTRKAASTRATAGSAKEKS